MLLTISNNINCYLNCIEEYMYVCRYVSVGWFWAFSTSRISSRGEAFPHIYKLTTNPFHNQFEIITTHVQKHFLIYERHQNNCIKGILSQMNAKSSWFFFVFFCCNTHLSLDISLIVGYILNDKHSYNTSTLLAICWNDLHIHGFLW